MEELQAQIQDYLNAHADNVSYALETFRAFAEQAAGVVLALEPTIGQMVRTIAASQTVIDGYEDFIAHRLAAFTATLEAVAVTAEVDAAEAEAAADHRAVTPSRGYALSPEQARKLLLAAGAAVSGVASLQAILRDVVGPDASPFVVLYWSAMLTITVVWIVYVATWRE